MTTKSSEITTIVDSIGQPLDSKTSYLKVAWNLSFTLILLITALVLFVLCLHTGIPFALLTKDPIALMNGKFYFGLFSNLGVLLWCATASLCLFTATVGRQIFTPSTRCFFVTSGLLTFVLMIDDLFLLHELVFPNILGVRQRYVVLLYLLVTASYLVYHYRYIVCRRPWLFAVALCLFTVSVAEDTLSLFTGDLHYLVEDGSKFFGILTWFHYYLDVSRKEMARCLRCKEA